MMNVCVYCGFTQREVFRKEHVVPASLGTFLLDGKEVTVDDRVCDSCNNAFSRFEIELVYRGPETLFRRAAGVKGRFRKTKKENPFYNSKKAPKPIDLIGTRPGQSVPLLWEVDEHTGYAGELNQIVFKDSQDNWQHVRLYKGMKKTELINQIQMKGATLQREFYISHDPKDLPWIKDIFEKDFEKIVPVDTSIFPTHQIVPMHAEFSVTQGYARSIGKIVFNYLMYFKPHGLSGYEPCFKNIREFIANGSGDPNCFIAHHRIPILIDSSPGYESSEKGHLLCIEIINGEIIGQIQLFANPRHGKLLVRLGRFPNAILPNEGIAHWFKIVSKHGDKKDAGEVLPVNVAKKVDPLPSIHSYISMLRSTTKTKFIPWASR